MSTPASISNRHTCIKRLHFIGLLLFTMCGLLQVGKADHVAGGNLEMLALDKTPGRYQVNLIVYYDNTSSFGVSSDLPVLIYRKKDQTYVSYVDVYRQDALTKKVTYTNQACAAKNQISTTIYRYTGLVTLDPAKYNDPEGYYMMWQSCCRNVSTANIKSFTGGAMFSYYLEFPPLTRQSQPLVNSSPVFDREVYP